MKACSYFCTACMVLLVFCTAAGQDPQRPELTSLPVGAATVVEVKGIVAFYAPQGGPLTAQQGQVLFPESRIETDKGSALLTLQDGSQVLVKSHSRVVLKAPDQGKGYSLELLIGKIVNKIQKRLGSNPSFRMGTPTAVITVRGTRFEVEVTKKLRTYVVVYEGLVEVSGLVGGAPPVFLRPGFSTNVERDRGPDQPHEIGDLGDRSGSESGRGREGAGQPGSEREGQQPGQNSGKENSPNRNGPDN
jgi:ferric-dicitrate binding protein FerR (iron transport regulator)